MRIASLSILAALFLLSALASSVGASDTWCDTDPIMVVTTPGGSHVPLYVTTGAYGTEHLPAAQLAQASYTVTPTSNRQATSVTVTVAVGNDAFSSHFQTRAGVSTGPFQTGTVYAHTLGYSDQTMTMHFVLSEK